MLEKVNDARAHNGEEKFAPFKMSRSLDMKKWKKSEKGKWIHLLCLLYLLSTRVIVERMGKGADFGRWLRERR